MLDKEKFKELDEAIELYNLYLMSHYLFFIGTRTIIKTLKKYKNER